ncbi:MAG: hypothetical protein LBL97_05315 [Prevotellaceae bacterium]|nr:hypothetical protein [Prevotellaceae bacterium]
MKSKLPDDDYVAFIPDADRRNIEQVLRKREAAKQELSKMKREAEEKAREKGE